MTQELAALRRSSDDAMLGGLCAALARRYDVDPTLVRVGFVMLGLCSGVGAVLYGAGWLLLARDDEERSPLRRSVPSLGPVARPAWVVIIVVACLVVGFVGESLLPFGLIAAGVLLWLARWWARRVDRADTAPEQWPVLPAVQAAQLTGTQPVVATAGPSAPTDVASQETSDASARPVRPTRSGHPRRLLWLPGVTTAAAFVGVGALFAAGVLAPGPVPILGAACLGTGVGLVVRSFVARPHRLATAVVVFVLCTGLAALAPTTPLEGATIGDLRVSPTSVDQLHDVRSSMGDVTVDYADLDLTADATTQVHSSVGSVTITLPRDANCVVEWSSKLGTYHDPERSVDTPHAAGTYRHLVNPSVPTLTVVVASDIGEIRVVTP